MFRGAELSGLGIHTVCAVSSNLSKGGSYYANLALKVNTKAGGINHVLQPQSLGFLSEGNTMVMGIDVAHPAPNNMLETPSIAAVVASTDAAFAQYLGSIRCQQSRQEIVAELDIMVQERLRHWKAKNGRLPTRILVYRDGVSEGQYEALLISGRDKRTEQHRTSELDAVRKACEAMYRPGPMPKITIVVVGKRHHTRFLPVETKEADSKGNPKNGTIVDRGITMEKGVRSSSSTLKRAC